MNRKLLLGGAMLAVTALACLAVLELGLRLFRSDDRYFPYYPNSVHFNYPSEEITPGVSGVSRFSTNSLGTRGREPTGREQLRILTVGGSTTADTILDDSEAWPARLEQFLGEALGDPDLVWVANSGIDGLNSHHHLMHARYLVPRLQPLDYAVVYAGANDMGLWLHHREFDPHYLDDPENWNSRVGEAFRWSWHTPKDWPVYKRSEIWKTLSWLKNVYLAPTSAAGDDDAPQAIVQDAELRWLEEQREKRRTRRRQLLPQAKLDTLPAALDAYERVLERIVLELRGHDVEPILVQQVRQSIFESQEERDRLWMGALEGGETYVSEDQLPLILAEYNRRMAEVARKHGVFLIDLPERIDRGGRLFYDGLHFNEAGASAAARAIADAMIEAGLIDLAHTEQGESPRRLVR